MCTDSEFGQRFKCGRAARSDEHLLDDTAACNEKSDGSADVSRELAGGTRQLGRDDERRWNTPSIQPLQRRKVTGFQAAGMSMNRGDGRAPW